MTENWGNNQHNQMEWDDGDWDDNDDGDWDQCDDGIQHDSSDHDDIADASYNIDDNIYTQPFLLKSVPDIISYRTQCLLTGYTSHRNLKISSDQSIPMEIQSLCCTYFCADFIKQIEKHLFTLNQINQSTKDKIISYLFTALCPEPNYKSFISISCDVIDIIYSSKKLSHDFYIYLSVLLLITKSSVFSDALLNKTEINNKIINICTSDVINRYLTDITTQNYKLQILISLFNQNINYFLLFREKSNHSIWQYLQQNKRKSLNISFTKSLCRHLLCDALRYSGDIDSDIDVWKFAAKCSINDERIFFLIKELEFMVNDTQMNGIHIRDNILNHIKHLTERMFADAMLSGIDKILIAAFYSMITRLQLMISDELISFDSYSKIIIYSMDPENKLNEGGWKLFRHFVDELESVGTEYVYFDKLISFIENKTGKFKTAMKSILGELKEKIDSDRIEAQNRLKLSVEVCWKINKLIQQRVINENYVMNFIKFYQKVTKTKLIKPILQSLESKKSNN